MIGSGLAGKVAIVTGGASGIGASAARLLAAAGAFIVVADINHSEGTAVAGEIGEGALFVRHDVRHAKDWEALFEKTEEKFGPVSILVNNAGIAAAPVSLEDVSEADYRHMIEVNQISCVLGMRAAVPSMRRAGGGAIVNVSSVAGLKAERGAIAYTASKFAVTGMTKVAALDLAKDGIRVNSVHPGLVETPMVRPAEGAEAFDAIMQFAAGLPIPRLGQPEDIANLILFLASDSASFLTGGAYLADGGWTL